MRINQAFIRLEDRPIAVNFASATDIADYCYLTITQGWDSLSFCGSRPTMESLMRAISGEWEWEKNK